MIRKIPAEARQSYKPQGFPVYADMCPCDGGFEVCQWSVRLDTTGPILGITIEGVEYPTTSDIPYTDPPSKEYIEEHIRSGYLAAGYIEDGVKDPAILTIEDTDDEDQVFISWSDVPPATVITTADGDFATTVKCNPAILCEYPVLYTPDNGATQSVLTISGEEEDIPDHEAGVTPIATIEADFASVLSPLVEVVSVTYDPISLAYTVTLSSIAGLEVSLESGGTSRTAEECNCKDGYIA